MSSRSFAETEGLRFSKLGVKMVAGRDLHLQLGVLFGLVVSLDRLLDDRIKGTECIAGRGLLLDAIACVFCQFL